MFVVGCGGGVAHYTDAQQHVRRGDVVVSAGKYAYVHCDRLKVDRYNADKVVFC